MKAKSVGCLFYWSLVFAFIIIQYNFLDIIVVMYLHIVPSWILAIAFLMCAICLFVISASVPPYITALVCKVCAKLCKTAA